MYEPKPNGTLQLVGVDYVVPLGASEKPPTLLGQEFVAIDALGVWALHILGVAAESGWHVRDVQPERELRVGSLIHSAGGQRPSAEVLGMLLS